MTPRIHPGPQTMAAARKAVDEARADLMATRRLDGAERSRLVTSQRRLLGALESYIRVLAAAGLAPHQHLRDEVALLQAVTAQSSSRSR